MGKTSGFLALNIMTLDAHIIGVFPPAGGALNEGGAFDRTLHPQFSQLVTRAGQPSQQPLSGESDSTKECWHQVSGNEL